MKKIFNQFVFQPIVNQYKEIKMYEMLYKPVNGQKHTSLDDYFNDLSEEEAIEFDFYTLESLERYLECCPEYVKFSINISPLSILNPRFMQKVKNMIVHNKIDFSRVCLEIVENRKLPDLSLKTICFLEVLKNEYCAISLDDFTKGHLHWELLQNKFVDYIKIINSKSKSSAKQRLFHKNMVNFCHSLKVKAILENVETEEAFLLGKNNGFDFFQGFYFNKPETIFEVAVCEQMYLSKKEQNHFSSGYE